MSGGDRALPDIGRPEPQRRRWPWFLRRVNGFVGSVLLFVVFGAAFAGLVWTPYDPVAPDFRARFMPPDAAHWMGTDEWGRDVFSRILQGARTSVFVALSSVSLAVIAGTLIGGLSGFFGSWLDRIVIMLTDALLAFPGLLLALAIMAIAGPSEEGVVLALALSYMPSVIRLVRGTVLSIREKEYVEASRAMGNGALFTLFRHVLPNCTAPLIVMATALFGSALLAESALSFLGLGVPPPAPTWGNMLSEARGYFVQAPWLAAFPGLCISLALLGINIFGDALRDRLDPRMRGFDGGRQ